MKKLLVAALVIAIVGAVGWQKRVELLVVAAPRLQG